MKLLFACAASAAFLSGQSPAVLTTGLQNPSKLVLTPAGNLLVSETGVTPNSGRVSFVDKSGNRRTLIDGLPSGLAAPDLAPDGPNGLALAGGTTLYIAIGEGDSFRAGSKPNTITPNPNGVSSPIFASILKLTLTQSVDTFAGSFTLALQDQNTLADGNTATLNTAAGDTATLDMVTFFRSGVPDPVTVWRNSHPYALTLHPAYPDSLFVADAGMNALVQVSLTTGRARTLVHFLKLPSHALPPVSEAVPDSVHPFGSQLLVSFLAGFPFTPGTSEVVTIDPATGTVVPFIPNLSSAIDVLDVPLAGPRDLFFTLEYSTAMSATPPAPRRVTRYDSAQGQVIASGLNGPTSLAYDAASGNLYITSRTDGSILTVTGQ